VNIPAGTKVCVLTDVRNNYRQVTGKLHSHYDGTRDPYLIIVPEGDNYPTYINGWNVTAVSILAPPVADYGSLLRNFNKMMVERPLKDRVSDLEACVRDMTAELKTKKDKRR
jgi:hypothetical protein